LVRLMRDHLQTWLTEHRIERDADDLTLQRGFMDSR
jgi:hypothetical protein